MYVIICGAGELGGALAIRLAEAKHTVVCIESSRERSEHLYARYGITTHTGSATDIEILKDAGIEKSDVVVGTMSADADNLALTILARQFGVKRIIMRMRDPAYETAYRSAGATRLVSLVDLVLGQLLLEIEQPDLRAVATFGGGKASILILTISEDWCKSGTTVAEVAASKDFPAQCVITGIFREQENEFVFPRGNSEIRAGDKVFMAAAMADLKQASDFFGVNTPKK
ncbi:MAG: TrkA family potassium uptake protein [Planctomycetes bacterium]|nr:TrkA family potassium uptake protein [Planctomycetota bacterium]